MLIHVSKSVSLCDWSVTHSETYRVTHRSDVSVPGIITASNGRTMGE
jgi:hypothetical protein